MAFASAVAVALAAPLRVIKAPTPPEVGVMDPEIAKVPALAVKLTAVAGAPLMVTVALVGEKVVPALLGVTVYLPFGKLPKV